MSITLPEAQIIPLHGGPVLNWGVLAPGRIAGSWVSTVHANTDQKVVAVASRTLERAEEFARTHGIEHAYGDYAQVVENTAVDVVYIAAPHSEHETLALLAIGAGKHVLIEKPISTSVASARRIVDAARAAGVFAMEAMWSRFLPQTSIVAALLAREEFGELVSVDADFGVQFDFDPRDRMFAPELGGGALLDLGVYPAWFLHFVLGAPKSVTTRGSLAATGVDAQSTSILEFDTDVQGIMTTNLRATTPQIARINGTRARLEYTGPFLGPSGFRVVAPGLDPVEWFDRSGFSWGEGLCYQVPAVAQHIADGLTESPLHSLDDSLEILAVLDEGRAQLGAI